MEGALPRVTLKVLLPPLEGRSTTTVIVEPGAYERIFTIAASAFEIRIPSIERITDPTGMPALSAPSPGLNL